jgi:hypothetical protein
VVEQKTSCTREEQWPSSWELLIIAILSSWDEPDRGLLMNPVANPARRRRAVATGRPRWGKGPPTRAGSGCRPPLTPTWSILHLDQAGRKRLRLPRTAAAAAARGSLSLEGKIFLWHAPQSGFFSNQKVGEIANAFGARLRAEERGSSVQQVVFRCFYPCGSTCL